MSQDDLPVLVDSGVIIVFPLPGMNYKGGVSIDNKVFIIFPESLIIRRQKNKYKSSYSAWNFDGLRVFCQKIWRVGGGLLLISKNRQ